MVGHNLCIDIGRGQGPMEGLRAYLENCSDLHHQNRDGKTALMLAQEHEWSDIISEYEIPIKSALDI